MLLEPIMLVTASVPESGVGDVMGDLSSRRGRPLGTEAVGGMTEVKAEVPMAEMLVLRARPALDHRRPGRVHDGVPRYEEIPAHLAQKVVERREAEEAVTRSARAGGTARGGCYPGRPVARTRDIKTNQQDISCDVCGRTLLRGERAEPFLAGGARRQVCELCTARAQHEGWIRESGADELALRSRRHEGRTRWIDRLRARRERAREVADAQAAQEAAEAGQHFDAPAGPPEPAAPPEPPRSPRHVRAVPTNAELKMERALDVFNALRPHAHGRRRRALARRARRSASARWPTARASSRSP